MDAATADSGWTQRDQIWRNIATLANFLKSLANVLRVYLTFANILNLFWHISMPLGKFWLLQMVKFWKISLTVWSHWLNHSSILSLKSKNNRHGEVSLFSWSPVWLVWIQPNK